MLTNGIRNFVSDFYENAEPNSLHANVLDSFGEFQIPNGSTFSTLHEINNCVKQDGSWIPAELVLPILALEWHTDFTKIPNSVESNFVNDCRSELIHEHQVLWNWDGNYVFLLCVSPDVNLCSQINEENVTQCVLLKKDTRSKSISVLFEINYKSSTTPKATNKCLDGVNNSQCKIMHQYNHQKTSKGHEMMLT